MGRFLGKMRLEETDTVWGGREVWRLHEPYGYDYGGSHQIVVPKGCLTDFASVPWFMWWLIRPTTGRKAAVIHDYLYRWPVFPRNIADAIFRDALRNAGVDPVRRWLMWFGVRLFGWRAFGAEREPRQ